MTITASLILFAVTWFMVFFIILPLRVTSQAEAGHVEPGTPRSAPSGFVVAQKARFTTLVALIVWGLLVAVITSDLISVRDIDVMGHMGPEPQEN
jgi:predicted secreted protein|tara:strand:- start:695 stop:979 length:285 start_codon:yes stop_codon:yes gene_type:complete